MTTYRTYYHRQIVVWLVIETLIISQTCLARNHNHNHNHRRNVSVNVEASVGRPIPPHFFGIFFEEINHAGAGGLWAELVSNRGFEAGGRHEPATISPWGIIGDERTISVMAEMSSCFLTNPMALRMDVHCDPISCPPGGVGVYNPGYWGMNIEEGKTYKLVYYIKTSGPLEAVWSLVNSDGTQVLAHDYVVFDEERVKNWTRMETTLKATGSDPNSRLQFNTRQNGTIWLDQVSAMPTDTYKEHGFRKDLMDMLLNLKPRFLRFPGGCYVEGVHLRNAYRWKETVGPWELRPGHFGDVWKYWSDDGLGYLEYLQLAEDLGAEPVWVVNIGMSHEDHVKPRLLKPFVQEMLDSIEFARGSPNTTWGSLRAKMGHPAPFSLKYVALGNEDCDQRLISYYRENYPKFYKALKQAYPDIKVISNCDATVKNLDHPADLFDYHKYTTAEKMLKLTSFFENMPRSKLNAPKAFVSEYAVTEPKEEVGSGTFKGALAEAAFLLSLEKNSDVVEMVSYAPLFVNQNDRRWTPDAISFDSQKSFGIASYWVQTFFGRSSGALLLDAHLDISSESPRNVYVTAISWTDNQEKKDYITIKVVNFNNNNVNLKISLDGIDRKSIQSVRKTVLASNDLLGDNTMDNPTKVVPETTTVKGSKKGVYELVVQPYSFTAFDLLNLAGKPRTTS